MLEIKENYPRIPIISARDSKEPEGIVVVSGSYLHGQLEEDAHYDIYFILEKDLPKEIPLTKWSFGGRASGDGNSWTIEPEDLYDCKLKTFAFDSCILKMEFKDKPCVGYYWTSHRPVYRSDTKEYLGEKYDIRGIVVYEDDIEAREDAEYKMNERKMLL